MSKVNVQPSNEDQSIQLRVSSSKEMDDRSDKEFVLRQEGLAHQTEEEQKRTEKQGDLEDGLNTRNSKMARSSEALLDSNKHGFEELNPIHIKRSKKYRQKFRYYFCHPYLRILIAYGVTICNFFIYAEDPVAHSFSECTIPVIGNDFAFVATRYPPNAFSFLKVFLYLIALVIGLIVGKLVIHYLLFRKCFKLSMFRNDQGSWMTMFFTCIVSLFIFSFIYNAFLGLNATMKASFGISSKMGITNHTFMKAAALGTWMGDFITAWMVTDMMLQETSKYPQWAKGARAWWNKGWHRVILFWTVLVVLTATVASAIISDYINWDTLNKDFVHTSELGRGFLAAFILVLDFSIVMQDWDFPMFDANMDIKLPGINTAYIQFKIPDCLRREHWVVHISGKWFNYGILFMVMLLDLNMWKNQIFYKPYDFGQYVGPNGKVYSVTDRAFLATANKTTLSYAWRWSHPSFNASYGMKDPVVNSRYRNYSMAVTGTAFIPSLIVFVVFGVLIWTFGRTEEKDNVEVLGLKSKPSMRNVGSISIRKEKDNVDGADEDDGEDDNDETVDGKCQEGDAKANYGTIDAGKETKDDNQVVV